MPHRMQMSLLRSRGSPDRVAERWTGRGTHRGELMGIPATGKAVAAPGSVFYRVAGGRIAEFRGQVDIMGLMRQLGVIAEPAAVG